MANVSSTKGNPASHRMGNKALQERRKASHARGEARKARNRIKNEKQAAANHEERWALAFYNPMADYFTPWQIRKAERAARRAPLREAYENYMRKPGATPSGWLTSPDRMAHKS